MDKKLLIISNRESTLSRMLAEICNVRRVAVNSCDNLDFPAYGAVALIGGISETPVILSGYARVKLEEFADSGKPVFLEYTDSFRCVYSANPEQLSHHRFVAAGDTVPELSAGDLLDGRYNNYIRPYCLMPGTEVLLSMHPYVTAHDKANWNREKILKGNAALWLDKNVLSAAFRLCDFDKGSFAPAARWEALVKYICVFLTGSAPVSFPQRQPFHRTTADADSYSDCIKRGLCWLERFLVNGGKNGILEGLSHNIRPDGQRIIASNIRTDSGGEAAGAFMFSGSEKYGEFAHSLMSFCFGPMMVRGGEYDGMLRWSEQAWEVCYQDDAARTIIGVLLAARFGITKQYLPDVYRALSFLCRTTCRDGLRPPRTDKLNFIAANKSIFSLADEPSGLPSAHYNAWYSAALLLGYLEGGEEAFLKTGVRGLETLMSLYPDTAREQSETSELCRLVLPLAVLCEATGAEKHKEWLYRITDDLERLALGGAYREWDTGYKAACSRNNNGECSLLAENGDPVCDLLYSVNWLPTGFSYAYRVTGDERFARLARNICAFFITSQSLSFDLLVDGSWGRGWDLERRENYGVPHDIGWGPCAAESGWTVAEVVMGLEITKRIFDEKGIRLF